VNAETTDGEEKQRCEQWIVHQFWFSAIEEHWLSYLSSEPESPFSTPVSQNCIAPGADCKAGCPSSLAFGGLGDDEPQPAIIF
jgi:hypothetical protein